MSQADYEYNRKIVEGDSRREAIATKYVQECLKAMDGSLEAGMKRIGTERFKDTVQKVMDALPYPKDK